MTEDPRQPEGEAPDEETPEDVTGDQAEDASGEEHPGPEIGGVEELAQAAGQVPEARRTRARSRCRGRGACRSRRRGACAPDAEEAAPDGRGAARGRGARG